MEEDGGRHRPDGGGADVGRGTSIHVTALDGIVNVNSLFTLGVFVGLAWNPTDPNNSLADGGCAAGNGVAEDMVSFHVFSFSCFLFSSLAALCLKQAIRLGRRRRRGEGIHLRGVGRWWEEHAWGAERMNRALLRAGIVVSAVGSVFGCGFLMMALVNVVQVKLGRLGCAGAAAAAIVPLVILVPTAMLIYVSIVFYAFTR